MSFEDNVRSIERAVRSDFVRLYGFTGSARLVQEGVEVCLSKDKETIYNIISWHQLASIRIPPGPHIVHGLIAKVAKPRSVF